MMNILYRKRRIKKIVKYWGFKRVNDLMGEHNLNKNTYKNFKHVVKK